MRRLILWLVLAFAMPTAYAQSAQPAPASEQVTEQVTEQVIEQPRGRSGFWTSPHPAKGGAYRWRMMAIGGGLLAATGYVMWRLVKKASAERAARGR